MACLNHLHEPAFQKKKKTQQLNAHAEYFWLEVE